MIFACKSQCVVAVFFAHLPLLLPGPAHLAREHLLTKLVPNLCPQMSYVMVLLSVASKAFATTVEEKYTSSGAATVRTSFFPEDAGRMKRFYITNSLRIRKVWLSKFFGYGPSVSWELLRVAQRLACVLGGRSLRAHHTLKQPWSRP